MMSGSSVANATPCNGAALRQATRRVSQLYDAVLAPCGLRTTQLSILAQIARAGAPTVGELAKALVLDRSALTHNLKPLDRDGLVALVANEDDRRSRRIVLTETGRARLAEARVLWKQAQERFEAAFGADHAAALRATLAEITSERFARTFRQGMRVTNL